jgi:asparagine synthase (glutamine-hydrolysing)
MCGICGEIRFDGQNGNVMLVSKMKSAIKHRGPDAEGLWQSDFEGGSVVLGHTRLAILDLSDAGNQPMCDASGRYYISYNGEIYNYLEIRKTLEKKGFIFKTGTDTEVVLAAYAHFKEKCLDLFNGMFAFAIWDDQTKKLFCARDRMGIKPFYFTKTNGNRFYFASEIKALLLALEKKPAPNPETIYDYLSLGLMHHNKNTFFSGIEQLPAGCFLKLDSSGASITRYWQLADQNLESSQYPDLEKLEYLLQDAVKLRLRSDVPVGILLSGGLDSSSITVLASSKNGKCPQSFSLKFNDELFDESAHAKLVASYCNTSLKLLTPQGKGLWSELDRLIKAQDAPTHAPEVYSNWCMMRAVIGSNTKVLLTGQGGDELFGGYNWYPKHLLATLLRKAKFGPLFRELYLLPKNFPNTNTKNRFVLLSTMLHALLPISLKVKLKPELSCVDEIMPSPVRENMRGRDYLNLRLLDPPCLEEKLYNDLICCNIPHYLHYEDANSMAFSIEERVPYLDHRVVEYTHQIAGWWKIHKGVNKYILRNVMKDHLPDQIVNRKDKMGLSAPRDQWFRNELRSPINQLFNGDCHIYDNWIERPKFLDHLNTYMQGKSSSISRLLWRCINLEKWLRINS